MRVARLLYRADYLLAQLGVVCALGLCPEDPAVAQPVVTHKVLWLEVLVVDAHDGIDDLEGTYGCRLGARVSRLGAWGCRFVTASTTFCRKASKVRSMRKTTCSEQ
tara:strand:+ start:273 stop:590 length:318 start_codon:yes stop_codon:yes gene_type:complete